MSNSRRSRAARALALTAAAAVGFAGLLVPAAVSQALPASGIDVAPDYLVATYGLPSDHVIETVTFERLEWLLNGKYDNNTTPVTGTFAFLIGGAYDANTKATIGYVNEVAKQYGVDKVYTFDPALDGDTLDVFDASGAPLDPAGRAVVEALGTRVLTYLNADTTPGFTKADTDPYLFIYDRNHTVDVGGVATQDRIVASLNVRKSAAELSDPTDIADYKAQVAAVFDSVSVAGVADVDALDQFTFWKAEANRRHTGSYTPATTYGGEIISDTDDDAGWRVETLTYPELEFLLQQQGDYAILFGGTWCHNTRAVIKQINHEAQDAGVPVVYNFDNSLDSTGNGGTNYLHIRDNPAIPTGGTLPRRASYLYGDLWNTYLPNVVTQYRTASTEPWLGSASPVQFYPGGDVTEPLQVARKGQVPFLLTYNKDNLEGGVAAPVTSQWIQQNAGTGGWTEYMIEWWQTPTAGALSGNTSAKAFAAAAESALGTFFDNLPNGAGLAPAAPSAPTAAASGTSVTVTWDAPALPVANTVSSDSTVTGYTVSLDGGAPVSVGRTPRTYVFTGVAAGAHTATVVAVSSAGSSPASAPSNSVSVTTAPDAPAAPVASVSGTAVTVTWSAPSTGGSAITGYTVALDGGTPVSLGLVTSHTFTGVGAGDHTATIVAVNAIGSSAASAASNSVSVAAPATAPATPAAPIASVGGNSVTVTWSAPSTGGSAITGYEVALDGGTSVSVGLVTSHTFTAVGAGSHTATIVAVNAVGSSSASPASNSVSVVTAATAPATPAAPVASVSGTSVTVTWSAPSAGGSAITGYSVALDGGAPVSLGLVTSHTFTGVAVGAYTATVVAVNAVGSSAVSPASNSVSVAAAVDPATVIGTLAVSSASQSGKVTIGGSGFAPNTTFEIEIHSTPHPLGSVTTNSLGAFTFTASIPSSVPAGAHSIVVLYNGTIVSSQAIVLAADGSLAGTGLDAHSLTNLTIAGVLALLLGGGLAAAAVISRRRRSA